MNSPERRAIKTTIFVVLIFIVSLILFIYSVQIRKPFFTDLSEEHHQSLTGGTVLFARHWFREGIFKTGFMMIANPKSVEFNGPRERYVCCTYPPGAPIPVYLISRLIDKEATPGLVFKYNLGNHFFIAFFLSLIVFFFVLRITNKYLSAFIFALIPVLFELMSPLPLYYHQNVFFADQAVILPFVLIIFLESLRTADKKSRLLDVLEWLVILWGLLTEWLFIFVVPVLFLIKLLDGDFGKSGRAVRNIFIFFLPAVIVAVVYICQVLSQDAVGLLVKKFMLRTGLSDNGGVSFFKMFWLNYFAGGYNGAGVWLMWSSLVFLLLAVVFLMIKRRVLKNNFYLEAVYKAVSISALALLPCFLHIYFLFNHSFSHDFSALKFSVPMALLPFVFLPLIVIMSFQYYNGLKNSGSETSGGTGQNAVRLKYAPFILLALAAVYIFSFHGRYVFYFPKPADGYRAVGEFLDRNTGYEDIVFSTSYEIILNPIQLAYSMKRVYRINGLQDIIDFVKNTDLRGEYVINLFEKDKTHIREAPGLRALIAGAKKAESENMVLYKIDRRTFGKIMSEYWKKSIEGGRKPPG
ncbi:MAG: hypothetical protein M1269_08780 [Chloroflexi bacterium]|nr:hypothetical protein [Chloroflexota bacterium]